MPAQTNSPIAEEMGALGEQLRKTAVQATEQARQTISDAQQQFQRNLSQAQQAQGDLANVVARINEQNSRLVSAAFSSFWDASLSMLKLSTWGQEQVGSGVQQMIEQGRLTREEGTRILREAAEQTRQHQAEMVRLAQESLRTSLEAFSSIGTPPQGAEKIGR